MNGRTTATAQPRLALVGCGAIAEQFHFPALSRFEGVVSRLLLVDPNPERARALAGAHPVAGVLTDHREALDRVDGAIVAAPQQFHGPIVRNFLRAGVPVLCEKPLAESAAAARELVEEGRRTGAALAVNNTRRLYPASREVRRLFRTGLLGTPRSFEFVEGEAFEWPAASASYFGVRGHGRGVLLDKGAHVLDLICWWLGERPRLVRYRDDAMGGTEATVCVDLATDGCRGKVELSWLTKRKNAFRITGSEGTVEGTVYGWDSVRFLGSNGRWRSLPGEGERHVKSDFANLLIDNFLEVVRGEAEPLVPGDVVLDSLSLIEACYAARERFEMPWFPSAACLGRDAGIEVRHAP